jgi:hypothetical protein
MWTSVRIGVLAWALMAGALLPIPASAAGLLEKNFYLRGPRYDSILPSCDAALGVIAERFATKESRFWASALQLVGFADVRETALRPWAAGADQTIPRRFCSAKTMVSDGKWRPLYYSIIEDGGLIGVSWGVDFCVVGLDRNWAYNPACRMARP